MNRKTNLINLIGLAFALLIAMQTNAAAQILLNEIEIDPPSPTSDACQYTEVRGTAGSTVAANTYFVSVNSDAGSFGFANQAVNIGGQAVGANGTITLYNTSFGECPNRVYGTGTTRLNYFNPLRVGTGSETYLIVRSTGTLFSGQDLDTNDDGIFDPALGITVLDGFALLVNPEEEYVYGAAAGVVNISNTISLDQPDAVVRFGSNSTPFTAGAFFFGELAATPDETVTFAAPFSANFPTGAVLTPGNANAGAPVNANTDARADFDGDGRTDLSIFRSSNATWFINQSTAGQRTVQFGASSDIIVPGDFDGDARTDFGVFRPSIGTWFILQSSNNQMRGVQFGQSGDIPVVVDFDGDNRTDIAVFRPSNGVWFVRRSSDNIVAGVPFGAGGDVPVPGDYDGDNRDDLAVFRSGTWFINRSTSGATAVQFGVSSDEPVPNAYLP
ncbi:MAG: VCBS repeat-containing protein [Pyrinomonadaceae bacterium]|nr:VCBS repeat-containing protein [Pyrinomonadaceae bacterium]